MRRSILMLALAMAGAVPAARADAIPPPVEHTALQKSLMGVWQEENCLRTKFRSGHACLRRVIGFGESSVSVLNAWSGAPNSYSTSTAQSAWAEISATGNGAVISTSLEDGAELRLTFDGNILTILGNDRFEDARFRRLTGPIE